MYCPKCGSMLDPGANFCVVCGAPVESVSGRDGFLDQYTYDQGAYDRGSDRRHVPNRRRRRSVGTYVLLAVILVVLIVPVADILVRDAPEEPERSYSVGDLTVRGGLYNDLVVAESSGDSATLTYQGDGQVVWHVKDLCGTAFVQSGDVYVPRSYESTDGNVLTISTPGKYQVLLYDDGAQICSGTAVLDGDITDTYTWSRLNGGSHSYEVRFTYRFSDFLVYDEDDEYRRDSYSLPMSRFVVVDDTLLRLSDALADEYRQVHGSGASVTGQDYADYLLSFVQCVFAYPTQISPGPDGYYRLDTEGGYGDMFLEGAEEYWAFPMETLYHRMGDCEDTSFLLSALYSAAGYRSVLMTPPGHMMVGVVLDSFQPDTLYSVYYAYGEKTLTSTGERVFLCETTYDSAVPVGYYDQSMVGQVATVTEVTVVDPHVRA